VLPYRKAEGLSWEVQGGLDTGGGEGVEGTLEGKYIEDNPKSSEKRIPQSKGKGE